MRLKSSGILWLFLILLAKTATSLQRTCKTSIVRAFGLRSLIVPNQSNSLCRNVDVNCCTRNDQMKIHKTWNQISKGAIEGYHDLNLGKFGALVSFFRMKDSYRFSEVVKVFDKIVKPPEVFQQHLEEVTSLIERYDGKFYVGLIQHLIDEGRMKVFNSKVLQLRQNVLCTICNWNDHGYINNESMTVTYKYSFCNSLVENFLPVLDKKYSKIIKVLVFIDEFMYLISGRPIFDPLDRQTFQRYGLIIDRCSKKQDSIDECADVCREFNLNKFTYMFDGENEPLVTFLIAVKERLEPIMNVDEKELKKIFKFRVKEWRAQKLKDFRLNQSVVSTKIVSSLDTPIRMNSFDLQFQSQGVKSFLEYKHSSNSLQLDTLDDEISAFTLYRLSEPPADINRFIVLFDLHKGVDLFKGLDENNISAPVDQLLALINSNGVDLSNLDEYVDEEVKMLLNLVDIKDLTDFQIDIIMTFNRYVDTRGKAKDRGLLDGASALSVAAVMLWAIFNFF